MKDKNEDVTCNSRFVFFILQTTDCKKFKYPLKYLYKIVQILKYLFHIE